MLHSELLITSVLTPILDMGHSLADAWFHHVPYPVTLTNQCELSTLFPLTNPHHAYFESTLTNNFTYPTYSSALSFETTSVSMSNFIPNFTYDQTWPANNFSLQGELNNTILNEILNGSDKATEVVNGHQSTTANTHTESIVSQLEQKFSLDNMNPSLLMTEPSLILILAVLFEMLLPIPQRFKFSGMQAIFHRFANKVNRPETDSGQRAFAGFFLPLLILIFCVGVVLFLDIFTLGDSIITLLVMLLVLELHYPQEAALIIAQDLMAGRKEQARNHLYPFVLRETKKLSDMGIAKAACESTALRIMHGWFAVMIWYFIAGIEGAVLMQCFTVMSRAFNFKLPANYLFGRLVFVVFEVLLALPALVLAGLLTISTNPLKPWTSGMQGMQTYPSPVTGFILGALGGTLDIALGGPRYYFGRLIRLPQVGGSQAPNAESILKIMRKIRWCGLLLLACAVLIDLN